MKRNNCRRILVSLVMGGLVSMPAMAQQADTIKAAGMTLRECMEYAVSNSTKMKVAEADRNDEQVRRREAIMQAFTPYMNAGAGLYEEFGRHQDPGTNTYTTTSSFRNYYQVDAGIVLFDGFKAVNNLKVAGMSEQMGLTKEDQTRDEICLATMEAYCNAIYYSELEKVLEEQVSTAEAAVRKAELSEELGQKSYADVVQLRSELAQKEYQLTNTRNMGRDALLTLKDVMFWPADEELILDGPITEPLSFEADAQQVAEFAKQNQPSAGIARLTLESAQLDLKTARWGYSPRIRLDGGISTNYFTYPSDPNYQADAFNSQLRNNLGEAIQLSVSLPILDQFSRRSNIVRKKNAVKRASAQYDQKMRDIENEVYRAVNDRDGAKAAFRQAEKMAEVQEEAFALNSRRFEQGLISSLEYHTASESYLNACAERLGSLLKYRIKDCVVNYYNGIPYIEQF